MRKKGRRRYDAPIVVIGGEVVAVAAVFAVTCEGQDRPVRLMAAKDAINVQPQFSTKDGRLVRIRHIAWLPDFRIARRIEQVAHDLLDRAERRLQADWFDVTLDWAIKVIRFAAQKRKVPLIENHEIRAFTKSRADAQFEAITRRTRLITGELDKKASFQP
jgi:hypothetical protein